MKLSSRVPQVVFFSLIVLSTNVLFAQAESSVPLIDKVILQDGARTPVGVDSNSKEIPCNIISESGDSVVIDRSTVKGVQKNITISKTDVKDIVHGDKAQFALVELSAIVKSLPFKSEQASFYVNLLEKKFDPVIREYGSSPLLSEIKALREKISQELDRVQKGEVRLGEKWISAEEYFNYKDNYDCQAFIDRIRNHEGAFTLTSFQDYRSELEKYKGSIYFMDAVSELVKASDTKLNLEAVTEQSGASAINKEKNRLVESSEKLKQETDGLEANIRTLVNRRVQQKTTTWQAAALGSTPSGKRYLKTDVRTSEQASKLKAVAKYLERSDDLPYAQLSDDDVNQLLEMFKSLQDKLAELSKIRGDLPKMERDMMGSIRILQANIRSEVAKLKAYNPQAFNAKIEKIDASKAALKLFQETPSFATADVSKLISTLSAAQRSWQENAELSHILFDASEYLLNAVKKLVEEKRYNEASAIVQTVDSTVSATTVKPGTVFEERYSQVRKNILQIKSDIATTIKSDQENKLAREKRAKEIQTQIDMYIRNKEWGEIEQIKAEINDLGIADRLKGKIDISDKAIAGANNLVNAFMRTARGDINRAPEALRAATEAWAKNPKLQELQPFVIEGYKKAFSAKRYEDAMIWLDMASTLKVDKAELDIQQEIEKTATEVEAIQKKRMYLYVGIGVGVLVVIGLIAVGIVVFIRKKKSAADVLAVSPEGAHGAPHAPASPAAHVKPIKHVK